MIFVLLFSLFAIQTSFLHACELQNTPGSQSLLEPADAFTLLGISQSPKITLGSSGEPLIYVYKGPNGIRPVLFQEETDGGTLPAKLTEKLYRPTDVLLQEAKKTYTDYRSRAGGDNFAVLQAAHTASCAEIRNFKETVHTVFAYAAKSADSNTDPAEQAAELAAAELAAVHLAYKINLLELVMLRELMMRERPDATVIDVTKIKTPILDIIEFE